MSMVEMEERMVQEMKARMKQERVEKAKKEERMVQEGRVVCRGRPGVGW